MEIIGPVQIVAFLVAGVIVAFLMAIQLEKRGCQTELALDSVALISAVGGIVALLSDLGTLRDLNKDFSALNNRFDNFARIEEAEDEIERYFLYVSEILYPVLRPCQSIIALDGDQSVILPEQFSVPPPSKLWTQNSFDTVSECEDALNLYEIAQRVIGSPRLSIDLLEPYTSGYNQSVLVLQTFQKYFGNELPRVYSAVDINWETLRSMSGAVGYAEHTKEHTNPESRTIEESILTLQESIRFQTDEVLGDLRPLAPFWIYLLLSSISIEATKILLRWRGTIRPSGSPRPRP